MRKGQITRHEWGRSIDNPKTVECLHCGCIAYTTEVDDIGHTIDEYKLNGVWYEVPPKCITRKKPENGM